jgi:hypothetical protein
MTRPWLEKRIDERVGLWKIFGEHPDGMVDVDDGTSDIFIAIPRDQAERAVAAHDRFREELYRIFCGK